MFVLWAPEFRHPEKSCCALLYFTPTFSAHIPLSPAAFAWADLCRYPSWLMAFRVA
jgi:hypothetical protein